MSQGEITAVQPTASARRAQISLSLTAVFIRLRHWILVKLRILTHCFQPLSVKRYVACSGYVFFFSLSK